MIKIIGLVFFIFVVGCAPKIVDLNSLCKNIHNSYECAQKIEKYQLSKYNDYVKRVGNKLILKINNKSDEILEDSKKDTDESVSYTFRDYLKDINSYLLGIHYWEGGSYYLIN